MTLKQPYSFLIYTDGTDYYASDGVQVVYGGPDDAGGVDGSDPDAVIAAAVGDVSGTRKERIVINGVVPIDTKISLPAFTILDIIGTLTANAAITMIETNGHEVEVNGKLDMSNTATTGLLVQHSLNKGNVIINNVPASGIGLNFKVTDTNYGCYWNDFNVWIEGCGSQPAAGSYGVLFNSASPSTDPNMNKVSGRIQNLDVGLKVATGMENYLNFLDVSLCNTAYDLDADTTLVNCWEEENANFGLLIGSGVQIKKVGGYFEKYDYDGDNTGQVVSMENDGVYLRSKAGTNTPPIYFSVAAGGRCTVYYDGTYLFFYDIEHSEEILKINMIGAERGDIHILKNGQGLVLNNAAGTVTRRCRLNDAGDGWIFEAP